MKLRVTAIQRGCFSDGPGIRTTVFLKGCYLSCPWCCNPETIYFDKDLYFTRNTEVCGTSSICKTCEIKGGAQIKTNCPFGVFKPTYKDYDTLELLEILLKDKSLFIESNGGITFSGGEPLMHAEALLPLLQLLKDIGVHIAFESSLYAPSPNMRLLFNYVDYWLADVKFQFGFISHIEKDIYLKDFEYNLNYLQSSNVHVKYRMVLTHQAVKRVNQIVARFQKYNIKEVELLACHNLGNGKYNKLNKKFSLYNEPSEDDIRTIMNVFSSAGIRSQIMKI